MEGACGYGGENALSYLTEVNPGHMVWPNKPEPNCSMQMTRGIFILPYEFHS